MRPHEDFLPCAGAGAAEEEGEIDVCYCHIAHLSLLLFVVGLHVLAIYRRAAQLERKIDSLVSMIASTQQLQTSGTPPLTPESHDTVIVNDASNILLSQPQNAAQTSQSTQAAPKVAHFPLAIPSDSSTTFQLIPGFSFTLEEAQSYFNIYRREFMPNYPFVIIPDDMDPRHLYATSRCLFWTIMASVAPQSSATQQGVENWFRQYIADRMVVKQEKNLALLQAILIHLAW